MSACLEQTGHYSIAISKALHQHGLHALFLVNPRRIKAFGNQKLRRNKSDTADARLIARFLVAEQNDLTPWTPKTTENEQLTDLVRYTESITREIAKLKIKCESAIDPIVLKSLSRRIKSEQKELAAIRLR
ncbi:transposase, partial [Luteolibacter pohnpeiensis]|nr:transposase [Luteolibacter pohnpeiensis]